MSSPQFEITISHDGAQLSRLLIESGGYVIGSDPAADLPVAVEGVSRYHAHLTVNPTEMRIRDLGSEHGTLVAGQLAEEATRIWPNQKVLIGPAVLEARRVKLSGDETTLEAPAVAARRILPEEFQRERKYEISGTIGQGSMGAVLSAREATTHRTVAMKVMLANISEGDVVRFIAEAQITSQLEHPNIVPVHEVGVDEHGQVFYTMKLVKGVTLRAVLEELRAGDPATRAAYPLRRLLVVLMRVCDAMAFAHSRGVIHRDLKPENVMVGDFGEVLVMDWGVAKALGTPEPETYSRPAANASVSASVRSARSEESTWLTMVGSLIGTPHYMSPEQANGETDTLDERTDVWALGAILRHMLTLEQPVAGETADEILANVRAGRLLPIPAQAPHCPGGRVPESLIAVANKAQSLHREQRYATAAEFRAEIDAYLGGFATSAERAGAFRQLWLLMMRHRAVSAVLLVLLVLSIGFVLRLMASEHRAELSAESARTNATIAQKNEQSARTAQVAAINEKEAANRASARAQISLADAAYRDADSHTMIATLDAVSPDLRDSEWRYLRARADNSRLKFEPRDGVWFVGATPHPKKPGVFAVGTNRGDVLVVDGRTGERLSEIHTTERQRKSIWFRSLDFSPDGSRLVVGSLMGGGGAIYEVDSSKVLAEWDGLELDVVDFNDDGSRVLSTNGAQELQVRDGRTGELLWKYQPCMRAAFLPSGDVFAGSGNKLQVLDAATHAVKQELPAMRSTVCGVAVAPDGRTVYAVSTDSTVRGINLADGAVLFETRLSDRRAWSRLVLSSGGRYLIAATGAADRFRAVRAWDAKTGAPAQPILGSSTAVEGIAVHPLTDDLIITGPDTRVWSLANRTPTWTFKGGEESGVFWGDDDTFVPAGTAFRLAENGGIAAGPTPWPSSFKNATIACSGSGMLTVGFPSGQPSKPRIAVLRRSAEGVTIAHTLTWDPPLRVLRCNAGGTRLAAFDFYSNLGTWDTTTGAALPRCDTKGFRAFNGVAWLNEHRLVGLVSTRERGAPGWEERIILWDTDTGQQLRSMRHPASMDVIAAAPDGRSFAEGGLDQKVRIRDPETLETVREFRAHDGTVTALAYHPTKPILATGSADQTVRLWDLQNGSLIEEFRLPGTETRGLQFSPSGDRLAGTDDARGVRVWDLSAPFSPAREQMIVAVRMGREKAAELRQRGDEAANAGRWSEAQAALAEALGFDPVDHIHWMHLAPVFVQNGDTAKYRAFCHDMLQRFGATKDPVVMERVAKASLLASIDDADRAIAIRLGHGAVTAGQGHQFFDWFRFADSLAFYRAGEFAPAMENLRALRHDPPQNMLDLLAGSTLAMAQHRAGQTAEARATLDTTAAAANRMMPPPGADLGDVWHDWLAIRLLLREAKETIERKN
jgi:serine/threonine protein kinase/WD40 repeat protein